MAVRVHDVKVKYDVYYLSYFVNPDQTRDGQVNYIICDLTKPICATWTVVDMVTKMENLPGLEKFFAIVGFPSAIA